MKYSYKVGEKVVITDNQKEKEVAIIAKGMDKCRLVYFYNDESGQTKWFYENEVHSSEKK